MAPLGAVPERCEYSDSAPEAATGAPFGHHDGVTGGTTTAPRTHTAWVAWLEGHVNWPKLGPKRKEIAILLALNELDATTGVLSALTNRELAKRYPGYSPVDFKNTFAALRNYGIARPEEQFLPARFGRLQGPTRYTLVATEDGRAWSTGEYRAERSRKAAVTRRGRTVGKLAFTPFDDEQARERIRRP